MSDTSSSVPLSDQPIRVGYLGPEATFCEEALQTQPDLASQELVAYPSMPQVLHAAETGEVDLGVVAIENALEGMVNVTVDTLAFEVEVFIQREIVLPVHLNLLTVPGASIGDITQVVSMPMAFGQCREFLHASLPGIALRPVDSTAAAARLVGESGDPTVAAIANSLAAKRYGLDVLAEGIEDHPDNATRFVVVAPHTIRAPTGHDKSTVVVFQHADRPGSLLAILQEFAARSINLTRLESRPTKSRLGNYCFLIDLEGHVANEVVADALRTIHAEQQGVKFLGSYPAAGTDGPAARADADDASRAARNWMQDVRSYIVS